MVRLARRNVDPRILRTRRSLEDALLDLGASKAFASITVADVVTTAGVSRSTFYDHFVDVEDLLLHTLDEGVRLENPDRGATVPAEKAPQVIADFLRHVERHHALYRSALGEGGSMTFLHALQKRITSDLEHNLGRADPATPLQREVATAAACGIVVGILMSWIDMEPLPAAVDAADWMWEALQRSSGT